MALQKVKPFNVDILKIHRVDQGKGFAIRGALVLLKVQPLNVEIVETQSAKTNMDCTKVAVVASVK